MRAIYVTIRPYLWEFIDEVTDLYEVVFFTHEDEDYSNAVLDQIDPDRKTSAWLYNICYKDSCYCHEGVYIKDLSRLGREFEDLI